MRKVVVTWKNRNGKCDEPFIEGERGSFPIGHPDPEQWCRTCVARFNDTLRPGESARDIVAVIVTDGVREQDVAVAHVWRKTNLVTIIAGSRMYDTARCEVCGITGKRFGLSDITRDPAFKAAGYTTCNGAAALLARRGKRRLA